MRSTIARRWRPRAADAPFLVLAMVGAALLTWAALPHEHHMAIVREGAAVEVLTQTLYFLLPLLAWTRRRPGDDPRSWCAFGVVSLAFGAREMDLHKAWDGFNVIRVSHYLGDAPAHRKLLGVLIVVVIVAAAVHLLVRHAKPTWRAFRRGEPHAMAVAWFLGVLVVSKLLDRCVNLLEDDFRVAVSASVHALVSGLEEWLELGLPLIAGSALLRRDRALAEAGTDAAAPGIAAAPSRAATAASGGATAGRPLQRPRSHPSR